MTNKQVEVIIGYDPDIKQYVIFVPEYQQRFTGYTTYETTLKLCDYFKKFNQMAGEES